MLLHGFQQRGLGLGRGPVDLVGQDDIGEDWPFAQLKIPPVAVVDVAAGDVAGQQVWGELDAPEVQPQRDGKAVGGQRLGQAGIIFQQNVAASQNRRHNLAQDRPFAHNGLLHFGNDGIAQLGNFTQ